MSQDKLQRLVGRAKLLLLDFDGPVCSIFAHYSAPIVAALLRDVAVEHGATIGPEVADEQDPLEVLRWSANAGSARVLYAVEDALREAEISAARSAEPTAHAHELIRKAYELGRSVAIASNNSTPAITTYLSRHGLEALVSVVAGRIPYAPHTMKPDPSCLLRALNAVNTAAHNAVFVGDSLTDVTAARTAGVPVVAYANRPDKLETLRSAGADAIVTTMAEVVAALQG